MQTTILIQKAIQRQSASKVRLPSPIAQFKTFLNRGAKPSPEKEEEDKTLPLPDDEGGEHSGETADAPANGAQGETGGDTPDAPAGEASQDAPEPTQGASEDETDKTPPPAAKTPQGVVKDAPAKRGKAKGAKKRGKRGV